MAEENRKELLSDAGSEQQANSGRMPPEELDELYRKWDDNEKMKNLVEGTRDLFKPDSLPSGEFRQINASPLAKLADSSNTISAEPAAEQSHSTINTTGQNHPGDMELTPKETKYYTNIIDALLRASDLTTVSQRIIRRDLEQALGDKDLSAQKLAINSLIGERFNRINYKLETSNPETRGT
ncbi:hypothetical protein CHU98_g8896 [Xylaria longipes]|nr:hypothetical protein CHU98_g8896 [Xylaria longipes]